MKILELPVDTTVKCLCGCKFIFDIEDIEVNYLTLSNRVISRMTVRCPFCKTAVKLKEVEC